jgi:S1-C subfamily serine protease
MKLTLISIAILFILVSCSDFKTSVKINNPRPSIVSDDAILIYYSPKDNLPDSAEYIGDFSVEVENARYGFGGYRDLMNKLLNSIETRVKSAGGNLALVDPSSKTEKSEFVSGKFYLVKPLEKTIYTEESLKKIWESRKSDTIEGIYESDVKVEGIDNIDRIWLKFGVLKLDSSNYIMIYLEGFESTPLNYKINDLSRTWKTGDIYAYLKKTDNPNKFKSKVYSQNKCLDENSIIKMESGNLRISSGGTFELYMKIFPEKSQYESIESSLTGFAINNNKIMTCYHGVKETDNKIFVKGINGNFDKKYEVVVESTDKNNDIAILRILDSTFKLDFNPIPLTTKKMEIAEEIFVIGYPRSSLMGEEIKFTNGMINSTTGLSGKTNSYQISAPIQYGNSGSPMFDKNGNLIGMVTSLIPDANNVSYSLNYETIKDFIDKISINTNFGEENSMKDISLTEKVKLLKKSVYLIEVINTKRPEKKKSKAEIRRGK